MPKPKPAQEDKRCEFTFSDADRAVIAEELGLAFIKNPTITGLRDMARFFEDAKPKRGVVKMLLFAGTVERLSRHETVKDTPAGPLLRAAYRRAAAMPPAKPVDTDSPAIREALAGATAIMEAEGAE